MRAVASSLETLVSAFRDAGYPQVILAGDFKESDHPRKDDGKFGTGHGDGGSGATGTKKKSAKESSSDPEKSKENVKKKLDELPEVNIKNSLSPASVTDEVNYKNSRERVEKSLSKDEEEAVGRYVGDDYSAMRRAQIKGEPEDFKKLADDMSEAMNRELKNAKPMKLYRGMILSDQAAEKLLSNRNIELKSLTSFSLKGEEALSFAGVSKEGEHLGNQEGVRVLITGTIKAAAVPGSPETELVRAPPSKLRITGKTIHKTKTGEKVLVVYVKD